MYYVKIYDKWNCEFENLRKSFKYYTDARTEAVVISKKRWCEYAIIEDENFERLGWFENGLDLD